VIFLPHFVYFTDRK